MALGRELPDDLVADVLRRLPARSLAVSRCVCRAWRDLVDARRLLRADLLPRAVGGIFINYFTLHSPEFFARPTTGPFISGDFEFVPTFSESEVTDHCNGLLLCAGYSDDHDYVANPTTRQWARLPLPPPEPAASQMLSQTKCLVYDPTVSPHYAVFVIHTQSESAREPDGQMMLQCELGPVSSHPLQVYAYSSETGRWEERWFAPEVPDVVGTAIAVDDDTHLNRVYWREALYVLCKNGHVLRISITTAKYTLIPSPADAQFVCYGTFSLGKSRKGVYCGFEYNWYEHRIFLLFESCGGMVWELRHGVDLTTFSRKLHARDEDCSDDDQPNGPWILQDINYYKYPYVNNDDKHFEWNSDDDDVLNTEEMVKGCYSGYTSLLGFHPYKKVVFLNAASSRAVAYHWNTSKFQDLGNICPTDYHDPAGDVASIDTSFIYTPCWMEDLPQNSLEAPIEEKNNVYK